MEQPYLELAPRVSSLESDVRSLERSVEKLVLNIDKSHAELVTYINRNADCSKAQLDDISVQFNKSQKTAWPVLAAWAGIILTLVGMVGSILSKDIQKNASNNEILMERSIENQMQHEIMRGELKLLEYKQDHDKSGTSKD